MSIQVEKISDTEINVIQTDAVAIADMEAKLQKAQKELTAFTNYSQLKIADLQSVVDKYQSIIDEAGVLGVIPLTVVTKPGTGTRLL